MQHITTRHFIAPSNADRIGWFHHLGKRYSIKLPRKLKKHGKRCAQQEKAASGLRTKNMRITEMWYSTRFSRWFADFRSATL